MTTFAPSRYNFIVSAPGLEDDRMALFNASSGALLILEGEQSASLSDSLLSMSERFSDTEFPSDTLQQLLSGGYLIPEGIDEVARIRDRYWRARGDTPLVVTLTTTMDCNLGCYYCYEERSGARLKISDIQQIVDLVASRIKASGRHSLHIDWYGGEPLLNLEFIEAASLALQDYCAANGVTFVASIISNGSVWPDNVEAFIERHRIRQVQISFDGMKANHDKRRRYRRSHTPEDVPRSDLSSFERAVALVDRLVNCVRVDLRFNMDRGNCVDALPFIEFARRRGWFSAHYPAVMQPARLASYSAVSRFMRSHELSVAEFDALRSEIRRDLAGEAVIEESEVPDGYPYPKTSVCAALADNSVVIGADRLTYRCGLQVGERNRAVGALSDHKPAEHLPKYAKTDTEWWQAFDPTSLSTCSRCSFLPICWGGCPKKHLERDEHAILEQGRYWRRNLPRLIRQAAGFEPIPMSSEISEDLQFR